MIYAQSTIALLPGFPTVCISLHITTHSPHPTIYGYRPLFIFRADTHPVSKTVDGVPYDPSSWPYRWNICYSSGIDVNPMAYFWPWNRPGALPVFLGLFLALGAFDSALSGPPNALCWWWTGCSSMIQGRSCLLYTSPSPRDRG